MGRRVFGSAMRTVVLVSALAILLVAAASASARSGVVLDSDGPVVPSTTTAPWSVVVAVQTDAEGDGVQCTGSILDSTHILTAGHCMFDEDTNLQYPLSDIEVLAGIINSTDLSSIQERLVASVNVKPGYVSSSVDDDDDVAELTLSMPLTFNTSVAPVVLGQASALKVGTSATFYGWGESTNGGDALVEHYLTDVIDEPWVCADGTPSTICGVSQSGDSCPGDSGSGLIVQGAVPELVGVLDYSITTATTECLTGHISGFTDLTSPEVAQWLAGVASPPFAPRAEGDATISAAQPQVGGIATCVSPTWSDATAVNYIFLTPAGIVLQTGAQNTLVLPTIAAGQSIQCVADATSLGGTSYSGISTGTAAIAPQSKPTLDLSVKTDGSVSVSGPNASALTLTLTATATGPGAPKLTKTFKVKAGHPVAVSSLPVGAYSLCVASADEGVNAAAQVCKRWVHNGKALTFVSVRRRNGGVALSVQTPLLKKTVKIAWSSPGHSLVRRTVRLGSKVVAEVPAGGHGRWKAVITVPRVTWHGATLTGGVTSLSVSA
jgi:V8-like Glu-specific endopeptidase